MFFQPNHFEIDWKYSSLSLSLFVFSFSGYETQKRRPKRLSSFGRNLHLNISFAILWLLVSVLGGMDGKAAPTIQLCYDNFNVLWPYASVKLLFFLSGL
jgi:hypothetical protein